MPLQPVPSYRLLIINKKNIIYLVMNRILKLIAVIMPLLAYPYVLYAASADADFVSQSVPKSVEPDSVYITSVTFLNSGSVTWTDADNYHLGSQNPQDNLTWGAGT